MIDCFCRCDNEQSTITYGNVNLSVPRDNTITASTNVTTSDSVYAVATTAPESRNTNATNNYCDVTVIPNPSNNSNVKTKMDVDPAYHHQKLN